MQTVEREAGQVAAGLEAGVVAGQDEARRGPAHGAFVEGLLRRLDGAGDVVVLAGGAFQRQESGKRLGTEQPPVGVDGAVERILARLQLARLGFEGGFTRLVDMPGRRPDQVFTRRKMVEHGAARQAAGFGDGGIAGAIIAQLREQAHRRLQDLHPGTARLGRIAGGGILRPVLACVITHLRCLAALAHATAFTAVPVESFSSAFLTLEIRHFDL